MAFYKTSQLTTITAERASAITLASASEFPRPGVYHVETGSRGEVVQVDFLDDVAEVDVPSFEELQDREGLGEEFKEWYGMEVEADQFSFTKHEEHSEYWVKVAR